MHDLWKDLGMFQISVMSNNGLSNNGVNEGGTTCEALSPGRCPTAQQRQPATARRIRKKWSYEENRIVMECFFRSNPKVFGYRKRMHDLWKDLGMFQISVMSNNGLSNNGVNEGRTTCEALSPGRCPTAQQRQPATARRIRKKWSYEENRIVMECFFRSNPKVFGYRKRMHDLWKDLGMFQISVMSNNGLSNNGVNEGGTTCEALSPGRCPTGQQRQPATARRIRKKWSYEENRIVMECFFRSNPKVFGYRKKMHDLWKDLGMFQISVMSNNGLSNNGVNEGGTTCEALSPGRCPTAQQRQPATAGRIRKKWSYEENRIVMECFFRSNPKVFGYRKRMHDLWKDLGMFQISVMLISVKLIITLNKMKTSHGSGHDGIASFYLKIALPVVGGSLCDLFNKSLFAGKFPEDWKIARIAPIFKSGAKDDRSNYRPISVLPFISRLFEKLIFNQFYEYLDANKSLYEHQSGFRLLHSVATALMASTNDWYLNIDNGKYTGLIFIDLKKAFDTVDHEILLEKLKMYGVTGLEHDWFTSYLDNRKQFCRINGSSSDVKGINCGVPQGSCLGPLLFLIYINDLPFSLQKSHVSMYADDTTISLSSKSIGDLQNDLNLDLLKLQDWLHANKLSLNVVKTQSLIIGSGPNIRKIESQPDAQPSFSIGDQEIEMIANAKYLGVQVDSQLNWDKHVDTIKTKANRALGLIKYSKKYLPSDVLNKMYRGIVEPHLSYCSSVWGCCSNSKINVLQKIQNRAARIVTNSSYDASAAPLIQNLGWPTINNLIRKETATLTYKSLNSLAPVYMRKLFTKYSDDRERSLRSTETDLRLPLLKTVNGQKAFSYRGAKLWNSLEKEAKLAPSLKTFKERL